MASVLRASPTSCDHENVSRAAGGSGGSCAKGPLTEAVSFNWDEVQTGNGSTVVFLAGQVAHKVTRLTIGFADGTASNIPIVGERAGFDVNFYGAADTPAPHNATDISRSRRMNTWGNDSRFTKVVPMPSAGRLGPAFNAGMVNTMARTTPDQTGRGSVRRVTR